MPSTIFDEKGNSHEIDAINLIPPYEGALKQIYGRIGNFKTYYATQLAFKLLEEGQIVKTNWRIDWNGYDEREQIIPNLLVALGIKDHLWEFPKGNWEYFSILPSWAHERGYKNFLDWFKNQTDCTIMIDEGHMAFDSYQLTRVPIEERILITSTRHFDRSVYIISQRPSAIHVNYRANVNQFYKCEATSDSWFGRYFRVTEFQDTKNDVPDETLEEIRDPETGEITESKYKFAVSSQEYRVDKKMFERYDSKYLREGLPASQKNFAVSYPVTQKTGFKNLFRKRTKTDEERAEAEEQYLDRLREGTEKIYD